MTMSRIFLLSFLFLAGLRTGAAAASFDLAACLERGLQANPEILSRKIAVEESKKEIYKAQGLFMPTISVQRQDSVQQALKAAVSESREYPSYTGAVTSLRFSQPLFTGFAGTTALEKARYLREARHTELREARLSLIRDIRRQFFEYLRLLEDIETAKVTISGLEKQLNAANAFYEQEMAPQLQVLQAEVRLSSARQSLVQVQTQADNARRRLNELLSLPAEEASVEYVGRLEDFDLENISPLSCYAVRAQARPAVRLGEINVVLARKEAQVILARFLPKVNFDADINKRDVDYKYEGYTDYQENYWTLGLNMSMNLFQGGADAASYSQQQLAASRYEEELRKLRQQIDRELLSAYASRQEAFKRIDSAQKIKDVALAALDRARAAFELGLGTTMTVLDAQKEAAQAMGDVARARSDFLLAQADLDYLAGRDDAYPADADEADEGLSANAPPVNTVNGEP